MFYNMDKKHRKKNKMRAQEYYDMISKRVAEEICPECQNIMIRKMTKYKLLPFQRFKPKHTDFCPKCQEKAKQILKGK